RRADLLHDRGHAVHPRSARITLVLRPGGIPGADRIHRGKGVFVVDTRVLAVVDFWPTQKVPGTNRGTGARRDAPAKAVAALRERSVRGYVHLWPLCPGEPGTARGHLVLVHLRHAVRDHVELHPLPQ